MLTPKEKKLIAGLRNNARQKIKTIAQKNNLPVSSMFELLNKLEKNNIIQHSCRVNFDSIGYPVRMYITLKTELQNREPLQLYLEQHKQVNSLHIINSGYDFLVEAVFKNQKQAQDFMDLLEVNNAIVKKNVYNVIETIHQERFLTEEEHFD
ncbi:Lrp/AsnC family transcriptional regulator [Candidatus Woesearchaeota archaeon]|nr:MAG: Lrp/AsnC family transcriptional regulator [Candidatus Woesearchaeota archaeon]